MIDGKTVKQTIKYLEILLDSDELSNNEKGELNTILNFWRLYNNFN